MLGMSVDDSGIILSLVIGSGIMCDKIATTDLQESNSYIRTRKNSLEATVHDAAWSRRQKQVIVPSRANHVDHIRSLMNMSEEALQENR
jgi:hypothetical protein